MRDGTPLSVRVAETHVYERLNNKEKIRYSSRG